MAENNFTKIRIGVFGTYGFENLGDAAVADATIAGLKRHIPNSEIVGICQQPENVSLRHNIEAYSIFCEFRTAKSKATNIPLLTSFLSLRLARIILSLTPKSSSDSMRNTLREADMTRAPETLLPVTSPITNPALSSPMSMKS